MKKYACTHARRLLLIACCLAVPVFACAQVLMIKSDVVSTGPDILLRDMLMDQTGIPEGWLDRKVFDAPLDNEASVYPLTSVAYALQQYPDMKSASVSGSIKITVSRSQRRVTPREVTGAVEQHLGIKSGNSDEFMLEFAPLQRNIWIPRGETAFQVTRSRKARNFNQYDTYLVDISVDGVPICNVPVRLKKYELQQVWVAGRALDCGQLLQPEDLRSERMPVERKGEKRIPVEEAITGQEMDRAVKQGTPILRNYVRTPLCAKKGDYIMVTAGQGSLQISLRAKALSTGRLGERILCMNERSKRQILVQLTGIQKARVAQL